MAIKKKHSFILLELLIALGLVAMCILPFLHLPAKYVQKEIDSLFALALDEKAKEILIDYELSLYRSEVDGRSFFDLTRPTSTKEWTVQIALPGKMKRTYRVKQTVRPKAQKKDGQQEIFALLHINHTFIGPKGKKNSYPSRIIARRKACP